MSRMVEPSDFAGFAHRIIKALGKRVADADPESLTLFPMLREALDRAELEALQGLQAEGYSLSEMARPLGVTKQAIFARLRVVRS